MKICRTIEVLRVELKALREGGRKVGFVPTMGYLHAGHASLLREAASNNDVSVLSIFVNPMQFGPNEDLDRYPKDEEKDLALAGEFGIDLVFMPSAHEMYPERPLTSITVSQVTNRLCGASRPGHFDGVGLVIAKLFHLVQPDRAYFGLKDAQQVAVIQQLVNDLNFDVEIVPCPTVREPDGLALSSRNVYLSAEQRLQAVVLSQSLHLAEAWIVETEMNAERLVKLVTEHIGQSKDANIDYVELLRYPSLEPIAPDTTTHQVEETLILAMAVKFGTTRLIDNRLYQPCGGE